MTKHEPTTRAQQGDSAAETHSAVQTRSLGQRRVLILGASYGSLLAARLMMAGHASNLVCRASTAALMNSQGTIVRLPVKGHSGLVEVNSKAYPGLVTASDPSNCDPNDFDLAVLAMQEPQYSQADVSRLLDRVARARIPVVSIMNMPPLPYLARIPSLDVSALRSCYDDPRVWDSFDPALMTLCSPDPQAFRPPAEPINVLQVRLATNFKSAAFDNPEHTGLLRQLDTDIEASRVEIEGIATELPVKFKVHDSIFVPLAKWAMLLTGNYRCIGNGEMRSIKDAVHTDFATSQATYQWVVDLCTKLGASPKDLVPFEKYAQAAQSLTNPSSAARALASGAHSIERVDKLVQMIAASKGLSNPTIDSTVDAVERWLARNRTGTMAA